jgi:hypothetical protein
MACWAPAKALSSIRKSTSAPWETMVAMACLASKTLSKSPVLTVLYWIERSAVLTAAL